MVSKRRAKRKRKRKLSPEERRHNKVKKAHIRSVRSVLRDLGFDRVSELAEIEIAFGGQAGEFDDVFLYENLLLLIEYTTSQSSDVTGHLKNKKILFSKVMADTKGFMAYLRTKSTKFDERLGKSFHADKYIIKIMYCSLNSYDEAIKKIVDEPIYLDYPILKYFEKLASVIKMSAMPEVLAFLGLDPTAVAQRGVFPSKSQSDSYDGSILPEWSSGFPPGYKVVSFYVDAAALLSRAYVLRRDGWRGSFHAYQRMVLGSKIEAIRRTLKSDRRVFVNNIIATLPSDVHPEHPGGKTADITTMNNTEPVKIRLPKRANSIGLIDGQHRLYSYYETKEDDEEIARLRNQQNLLVTGVIYPEGLSRAKAERFEATLFLSINSNQTNAPTPLRQEIEVFLSPFSPTAIGRQVMQRLAKSGPLANHVENYFFDKGKLKTSSIVSYGLGPLIKLSGENSLFKLFRHPQKDEIANERSATGLEAYLQFATSTINLFLNAVKANVDPSRWTPDTAVENRLLTVTYVNSFLITLRLLIEHKYKLNFDKLNASLKGLNGFNFKSYHSSQYARMAEKIYEKYFQATGT
jgi:DGQHR domain-containing protein